MARAFPNRADVVKRLDRTFCKIKDELVYVRANPIEDLQDPEHKIRYWKLPSRFDTRGTPYDYRKDDFSYDGFEMGYCNSRGTARYFTRIPSRVNTVAITAGQVQDHEENRVGEDVLWSQDFVDCVAGVNVDRDKAIEMLLEGDARSVGINRYVALGIESKQITLHYRGRWVGMRQGNDFMLFEGKDRSIIQRELERLGVNLWQ